MDLQKLSSVSLYTHAYMHVHMHRQTDRYTSTHNWKLVVHSLVKQSYQATA